jgi:2-polyprenyl-3-methyl-5-hydroxy-6-metoxy-1,4-benzoquinol methylase
MKCRFCNSDVSVFLDLSHIPISVASDGRVVEIGIKLFKCSNCKLLQKESSSLLQKKYFKEFQSHLVSGGKEQVKFINGVAIPRSEIILDYFKKSISSNGALLDIGTGNGSFLKAYKKNFKDWSLFAQDIQSNCKNEVLKIIPNENYLVNDISEINNKFDFISIIHVLGHIPELNQFLQNLKNITHDDSKLLIQTPDIEKSFFDVVNIDLVTYFSKFTMQKIMSKYFKNISFYNTIHKETTLGINFDLEGIEYKESIEMKEIEYQVNLFKKFVIFLDAQTQQYIVFGTAPVSTYLGAILKNNLICFLDEDENRLEKSLLDKKIIHPNQIKSNQKIILPFTQESIINDIKQRYKSLNFVTPKEIINE